ncbi:HEPN domain-containing protein [Crateriforma conspicua]|uniref:HEPN domain-containing protein n=1 Tax=Crateriforma conspicua TaxID=2527996 RepID=UPI0011886F5A|nr:HEPN domain-containing protein [Crateriforma conspicua]QDV62760.1 hypothetical protein Mal65_18960 [Crateriforma conspicua]
MTLSIEAGSEFEESLQEFNLLLELAVQADENDEDEQYAVFLKCALLLLTSKFECFLEELVEEVGDWIRTENVPCSVLPIEISTHYTHRRSCNVESHYNQAKFEDIRVSSTALAKFWLDQDSGDFEIDCKFSYGKHGEKEVAKLLRRVGVPDPFDAINVEIEKADGTTQQVDMAGIVNSLTAIRNNVLHQNASPQLTHVFLLEKHACLLKFSQELVTHIENMLGGLVSQGT